MLSSYETKEQITRRQIGSLTIFSSVQETVFQYRLLGGVIFQKHNCTFKTFQNLVNFPMFTGYTQGRKIRNYLLYLNFWGYSSKYILITWTNWINTAKNFGS